VVVVAHRRILVEALEEIGGLLEERGPETTLAALLG
jgi:hypothetical protein